MLREVSRLSTKEGLALMVLAEALLRVSGRPPPPTSSSRTSSARGDFIHHETKSTAFLVNASGLGRSACRRELIQPGETPDGTIGRLVKRLGAPAVRHRHAPRRCG